jgi:GTPase
MSVSRQRVKTTVSAEPGALNPALQPETRPEFDTDRLAKGIRAADPATIGHAISLVESTLPEHRAAAVALLDECHRVPSDGFRVAVSGAPGVGKSTLIDALGSLLVDRGHRVAVLAIDPSSARTGGSILGDKTRMPRLAVSPRAFIRPSPSSGVLGGVGRYTRPAITICEASGFDVIFVETVGVGQSETAVRHMVDFFLLLTLTGAGDELQGIKRGIIEVADLIAVTKADGNNVAAAEAAAAGLQSALGFFPADSSGWTPTSMSCSAIGDTSGLERIWKSVQDQRRDTRATGFWKSRRSDQLVQWFEDEVVLRREELLSESQGKHRQSLLAKVAEGQMHPYAAADALLAG